MPAGRFQHGTAVCEAGCRAGRAGALLLVDVDGVISLFGFDPSSPPPGRFLLVDGIPHLISAAAGDHLRALAGAFELVWCTGWEEKADEHLRHALGLPKSCPHVTFNAAEGPSQPHWKLPAIERYAGPRRPLAWIDDSHDATCADWAGSRPGPTFLVTTEPAIGITDRHVEQLLAWARQAAAPSATKLAGGRGSL